MSKPWIGLTGLPGVGKDTVADYLVERYGYVKYSFADPLREFAEAVNPIVHIGITPVGGKQLMRYQEALAVYGYAESKKLFPEFRATLDRMGQGARDVFGEDFWMEQAIGTASNNERMGSPVFSDVRYENEADAVRYGSTSRGFVIHLTRPGTEAPNDNPVHAGIGWAFGIDWAIENTSGLGELYEHVDCVMEIAGVER